MVDDVSSVAEGDQQPDARLPLERRRRWYGAGTGALLLLVFVALPLGLVALQAS